MGGCPGICHGLMCVVRLRAIVLRWEGRRRGDRRLAGKIIRWKAWGGRRFGAVIGKEIVTFRDPLRRKVRVDGLEGIEGMAVHVVYTALTGVGSIGEGRGIIGVADRR